MTLLTIHIYLATSTDFIQFTLTKNILEFLSVSETNNLVKNSMLEGRFLSLPGTIASFRKECSFIDLNFEPALPSKDSQYLIHQESHCIGKTEWL